MPLAETIQPAIELAENGFPVNFVLAGDATSARTSYYAETAAVFRPGGVPLQQGQILKQPDLAKTLRLIAKKGPDVLYRGEIGAAIVAAQHATANGGKPGLMTMQDLADYHTVIREPIVGEYRGYRIAAMSPPSSGGLTMIQALKMIERYPLGDASAGFGFGSAKTLHVMAEAMRLAFADRSVWMGDEDYVPVPKRGLLDPRYVQIRGDLISLSSILPDPAPVGDPWDFQSARRSGRTMLAASEPVSHPGGYTTHFSVVDQWGNIVSYTTTKQAVEAPRISVTTTRNLINREAGFDEAEIAKLRALGHVVGSPADIGNVNAVFIDLATGRQYGAVDSTREGGLIGLPKGHHGKEHDDEERDN